MVGLALRTEKQVFEGINLVLACDVPEKNFGIELFLAYIVCWSFLLLAWAYGDRPGRQQPRTRTALFRSFILTRLRQPIHPNGSRLFYRGLSSLAIAVWHTSSQHQVSRPFGLGEFVIFQMRRTGHVHAFPGFLGDRLTMLTLGWAVTQAVQAGGLRIPVRERK